MLSFYNTNYNNMYTNQNYGYGQSVMNPYQQQSSLFGGYQTGYEQQSSYDANSMLNSLLPLIMGLFSNRQAVQQPVTSSISNSITGNSGQNNILNSIFNNLLNSQAGKTPVTIDEETIEIVSKEPPKKVYVFGNTSYPVSTKSSAAGDVDYSVTLEDEYEKYHSELVEAGIFDKLDSAAEEINQTYGDKFQKTVVIDEDGKLVGVYDTKEVMSANDGFKVGESYTQNTNTYKDKMITLPDGQQLEVAFNSLHSPLTLDLNGDGVKTSDKVVKYDIDGDGDLDKINDVADGTLTIRGGKDGKDLFGNNTDLDGDGKADGFTNGFEALKALASKEGLINGKDDMKLDAADLKMLKDKYQFGIKTAGYNSEVKSLEEVGITEINLGATDKVTEQANFDGQDNLLMTQDGATFKINGKEREYADVWHAVK